MARLLIGAAAYDQGPLWVVAYGQGCLRAIAYGGTYGHNTHGQAASRPGGHARRPSAAHNTVACVGATTVATRTRAVKVRGFVGGKRMILPLKYAKLRGVSFSEF
ncbi:hypothetical protein B296_00057533 [Ensete ventricosum]|uniref:Uncharacterized protein n=1 Tax=Ensete ventricosum TaxID=4639 RepID=A0A426X029_ENSVE|nr:hypothetical protein B296_00057533 [Ensete ventricosum]